MRVIIELGKSFRAELTKEMAQAIRGQLKQIILDEARALVRGQEMVVRKHVGRFITDRKSWDDMVRFINAESEALKSVGQR